MAVLRCKKCGGALYEDDIYVELNTKKIELGCYQCPNKLYLDYRKYSAFIKKLDNALKR